MGSWFLGEKEVISGYIFRKMNVISEEKDVCEES